MELIVFGTHGPDYLFTAGKYIHEATRSTHNRFRSEKKVVCVRLELTVEVLIAFSTYLCSLNSPYYTLLCQLWNSSRTFHALVYLTNLC